MLRRGPPGTIMFLPHRTTVWIRHWRKSACFDPIDHGKTLGLHQIRAHFASVLDKKSERRALFKPVAEPAGTFKVVLEPAALKAPELGGGCRERGLLSEHVAPWHKAAQDADALAR